MSKLLKRILVASAILISTFASVTPAGAATAPPKPPHSTLVKPLASGGGCSTSSVGFGWTISSCVSFYNGEIRPDAYIQRQGSSPNGCYVYVELVYANAVRSSRPYSCSGSRTGAHLYGDYVAARPGAYYTVVHVQVSPSQQTGFVYSPTEYV